MVQIIPSPQRKESFGSVIGKNVAQGLQSGTNFAAKLYENRLQNEAKEKLFAQEIAQKERLLEKEYGLRETLEQIKQQAKYSEKMKALQGLGLGDLLGSSSFQEEGFPPKENEMVQPPFLSKQKNLATEQKPLKSQLIPSSKIAQVASIDPSIAHVMQEHNKIVQKQQQREEEKEFQLYKLGREEETAISKPILLEMNDIRKNIPLQEQAIEDIKTASAEVSGLDYLADVTGFEPLRTAQGAKLKTAIKDFFLSDLTRAGARPNMWIEQQLADALPKIGRSPEANLITAEGMQFKVDLAKKRLELIDKLTEEDRRKHGYVKGDIDSRASKLMKPYIIERQKKLKEEIENIKGQYKKATTDRKVKKGTKLTPDIAIEFVQKYNGDREKAEKAAKALGYEW